ncbi:MAG: response regulator [Verrucomicrobiota bacterium]|nr:response regulator [Verrucomicrobiota bacterium]
MAANTRRQAGPKPPPQPVRILVVDDSQTMRRMVMSVLQPLGNVVFDQAASGLEAVERLALAPTGLMVLDLNMPDMHGFEVLRFLRQHQAYKDLPVLVLTTRGDDLSKTEALALGASAYLTKPFSQQELLDCARKLLGT